ncbi:hypothetical protein [Dysgonomonas sp. 25]|uniref:hypothetical protein n=1 Tax=Dysgonomonas sp. 25 TaxID=2302933 RepID=UPI0013D7E268|nr:hypothetical protein [Dysgonomonas sp. 25]
MKKLLLTTIILLAVSSVKAQCNLPYKSLSEFKNDTTAFMLYNFMDRAECYKGKTLKEVRNDLHLPVKWAMSTYNKRRPTISYGISIGILSNKESIEKIRNNKHNNTIYIYWEEAYPINPEEDFDAIKNNNLNYYNIYNNCKIKNIYTTIPEGEKYAKYRKMEEERLKKEDEEAKVKKKSLPPLPEEMGWSVKE